MVTQRELSRADRRERVRARAIADRLAEGDFQAAAFLQSAEFEEMTDAEVESLNEVAADRPAEDENQRVWTDEELDAEFPEDVVFRQKLDEFFPDGYGWVFELDRESIVGKALIEHLELEFPEAVGFFWLGDE